MARRCLRRDTDACQVRHANSELAESFRWGSEGMPGVIAIDRETTVKKNVKIVTAVVAMGLCVFAWFTLAGKTRPVSIQTPSSQSAGPSAGAAARSPDNPAVLDASLAARENAPIPTSPGPVSLKLRGELAAATDYRSFAYQALRRPKEGGYFYARFAAGVCRGNAQRMRMAQESVRNVVSANGTISAQHLAKLQNIGSKCMGFTGDAEIESFVKDIKQREADRLDPLVNAENRTRQSANEKPFDIVSLRNAIAAVVTSQDPLLFVASHPELLLARDPAAAATSGIRFDGKIYRSADSEKINMAIQLSGCEAAQPCYLDGTLELYCSGREVCYGDRRDYARFILKSVYGGSDSDYEEMLDIERKMRSALATGNPDVFMK